MILRLVIVCTVLYPVNCFCNSCILSNFVGLYAYDIYVSHHGYDSESCGGSLQNACSSVLHAVNTRSKNNDCILIDGTFWSSSNAVYVESTIFLNKSLRFKGISGRPALQCNNCHVNFVITSPQPYRNDRAVEVSFDNILLNGTNRKGLFTKVVSVKDASVSFSNCKISSGQPGIYYRCEYGCQLTMEKTIFSHNREGLCVHAFGEGSSILQVSIRNSAFLGKNGRSKYAFKYCIVGTHTECVSGIYGNHNIDIHIYNSRFQYFESGINVGIGAYGRLNMTISKCTFRNTGILRESGGAVFVSYQGVGDPDKFLNFVVRNSVFTNNAAASGAGINLNTVYPLSLTILDSVFRNNKATLQGGAVCSYGPNKVSIYRCRFEYNSCDPPKNSDVIETGYGGALAFVGPKGCVAKVFVNSSTFVSNTARALGGTLYSGLRSSEIELSEVSIESSHWRTIRAVEGNMIYSMSKMSLKNLTGSVVSPAHETNAIFITNDAISVDRLTKFICPTGFFVSFAAVQSQSNDSAMKIFSLFSMKCEMCSYNHYSLFSSMFIEQRTNNAKCHLCSPGGLCASGLTRPKNNFWGFQQRLGGITYVQLPIRYGCQGRQCIKYNSCAPNRSQMMCATCDTGYSESMLSEECIKNEDCNKRQFWLLGILIVAIYVILFLYKSEMFALVKRKLQKMHSSFGKHFNKPLSSTDDSYIGLRNDDLVDVNSQEITFDDSETEHVYRDEGLGGGLLKIMFYFYQIELIVNQNDYHIDLDFLQQLPRSFFNFDAVAFRDSRLCALDDVTPVAKIFIRIGLISVVFIVLCIIIIMSRICKRSPYKRVNRTGNILHQRALFAAFELFVLVYGANTTAIFKLLHCIDVDSKTRLFIQGSIECYTVWQVALMFLAFFWVLPYCLFVSFLPSLLLQKKTKKTGILIGCIFPLPFLFYLVLKMKRQSPDDESKTISDPVVERILKSLIEPIEVLRDLYI